MEIRAKISLAVEAFKQNLKSVTDGYGQMAKVAETADRMMTNAAKTGATTRRAYAEQTANNQIAQIRKVEQAAIDSNKRVQASYSAIKPQQLPLPLVQQSSRSTVTATTSTQGLPKRTTVEEIYAQKKATQDKIASDTAYYQRLAELAGKSRQQQFTQGAEAVAKYRQELDAKIKADTDFYARRAKLNADAVAAKNAADKQMADTKKFHEALNSPDFERNMASIRYALYDVANRAVAFSGAIVTSIGSAVQEFAKLESAFTSVERVTLGLSSGALANLKQSLFDIASSAPIAFEELAKIATLGGQMGIAAGSLDEFAQVVAKFSAVTGISADQAAQSFGRLAQMMDVPVSKFENLSSAILYAGVNSVATDREIVAMSESIASAGAQSGMSADQVIGLSTALASLKVRPEEARGVILRLFRTIDMEVSKGGPLLNDFASVLGIVGDASATAGEKTAQLWKQDSSKFFTSFIEGAQATGDLNGVLSALGITNTREINVISKLAGSTDVMTKAMADARKEYLLGQYANKAFATSQDDLASKFKMLEAAANEFQASFGEAIAGPVGFFVDALKQIAKVGAIIPGPIKAIAVALGLVAAAIATLGAGVAFGIAGLLAYKLAFDRLNMTGAGVGINIKTLSTLFKEMTGTISVSTLVTNGFSNGLMKVGVSETTTALATNRLSTAMKGLQASMGWISLAALAITTIWTIGEAAAQSAAKTAELGNAMIEAGGGSEELAKAIAKDTATFQETQQAISDLTVSYSGTVAAQKEAEMTALAVAEGTATYIDGIRGATVENGQLADASQIGADANKKYADSLGLIDAALAPVTSKMGAQTAAFMLDALAKYKGTSGDQATFFENLLDPKNSETKTTLEGFGLNAGALVVAGMKKSGGATEYVKTLETTLKGASAAIGGATNLDDAKNKLAEYGRQNKLTAEQVAVLSSQLTVGFGNIIKLQGIQLNSNLPQWLTDAAAGVDAMNSAAAKDQAVIDTQIQSMIDLGFEADVAKEAFSGLSEQLTGYIDAATSGEAANNAAADSFQNFAEGIQDTTDGLKGTRQDIANWVSFMKSAIEAAKANGEGFKGGVNRMINAIYALQKAGKDTKKPFEDFKGYLENAANADGYTELANNIKTATNPDQLKGIITAWIAAQNATTSAGKAAIAYGEILQGALAVDPTILDTYFKGITSSSGKAKTALEKLQEQIEKTFASLRNAISAQSALEALGQSMAENSKVFTRYTEGGRANIDALLATIDSLATKSNGDLQKFANSLGALRASMVSAGASSAAIKIIDTELKKTGKTAKKSASDVASFSQALQSIGDGSMLAAAAAADKLTSRLSNLFSVVIAGRKANLDLSAGYEEMQTKVADARREIDSINATIAELTAKKSTLEYQLKIAIKYGDTLRANEIQAQIDKAKTDIAKGNADIAKQQQLIAPTTSAGQLELLNTMEGQANKIYSTFGTLVAQGKMTQTELRKWADEQSQLYYDQAIAAGMADTDAKLLAGTIKKDLYDAIKKMPKISVDTKAAMANVSALQSAINGIKGKTVTVTTVYQSVYTSTGSPTTSSAPKATTTAKPSATTMVGSLKQMLAASGGYITGPGTGTSDSIPARLSNGEFVMSAAAVKTYGVDFMNSLNNMSTSSNSHPTTMSQMSNTQSQVVYLSPDDRSLLRAAIDRPVTLYADSTRLASSVNDGNVLLAQRGTN